jgi:predicted TIM-barrel fold metal-dependent hydrolase
VTSSAPPVRIDTHAHYFPPSIGAHFARAGDGEQRDKGAARLAVRDWTPAGHLSFMDAYAIDASVLSVGSVGATIGESRSVWVDDEGLRRELVRAANEDGATLIRDHGDRFGVLATLPLPDIDGAVTEAVHALDALGLDGICVATHYNAMYPGDARLEPLWAALDARDAIVLIHPTMPPNGLPPGLTVAGGDGLGAFTLEYPFETTRAAIHLIYAGVPRRHQRIRWQLSHAGGTLPFVLGRVAALHALDPRLNAELPEGPHVYASRFFYDTALSYAAQLRATTELAGTENIMFGSDWPPMKPLFDAGGGDKVPGFAEALPAPDAPQPVLGEIFEPSDLAAIEGRNALGLYTRLAFRYAGTSAVTSS